MALQCNITLNYASMTSGQSPAPQATLTVYNPNASAVVVTGASIVLTTLAGQYTTPGNAPQVPLGPGMTTVVPALSSITMGPFAVSIKTAANANPFQAINQGSNIFPLNPQPSSPPQVVYQVGALVYGSDGSINTAGVAPLLVSYAPPPPMNFQGGPLMFSAPNNIALGLLTGVL